ncbi:hypothetical protein NDU88_001730 [Pleurodeles waltl]|uniref:Uncharacterized protein n=1 Tax=Pleurodeles waltl TaxID=8319 RepID=A0AAV7ML84_PLEWA|nr:hypothetical protein NDU88_001730 [Pleurodeles waltl]
MLKIAPGGRGRGQAPVPPAAVSPGRQISDDLARAKRGSAATRKTRSAPLLPPMWLRHDSSSMRSNAIPSSSFGSRRTQHQAGNERAGHRSGVGRSRAGAHLAFSRQQF